MSTMEQQNEARANALMEKLKAVGGVIVLVCVTPFLVDLWRGYQQDQKRQVEGSPAEPKFCSDWFSYYEGFCKTYPDKCIGGPRKLARCDQGWDRP